MVKILIDFVKRFAPWIEEIVRGFGFGSLRLERSFCWIDPGNCGENFYQLRCLKAAKLVRAGLAVWERDGVVFTSPKIPGSVTSVFTIVRSSFPASCKFRVVDVGGGFGSLYFGLSDVLDQFVSEWSVVETPSILRLATRLENPDKLKFYRKIPERHSLGEPWVGICSASLQYMRDPVLHLDKLLMRSPDFVFLERVMLIDCNHDVLLSQRVQNDIVSLWAIGEVSLKTQMKGMDLIDEFICEEPSVRLGASKIYFKSFLWKKN